jgi:hypothetical protein
MTREGLVEAGFALQPAIIEAKTVKKDNNTIDLFGIVAGRINPPATVIGGPEPSG